MFCLAEGNGASVLGDEGGEGKGDGDHPVGSRHDASPVGKVVLKGLNGHYAQQSMTTKIQVLKTKKAILGRGNLA